MKIGYGFLIIGFFCLPTCMANIPLGLITYKDNSSLSFYCSPSRWGKPFPDQNQNEHALVFDQMDPYGCNENINMDYSKSIRVVDRGNCTFLKKATVAKKKKAMGLLIRNTLQAVYEQDIVKKNTSNGHSPYAYDCENGQAYVSTLEEQPWKTTAVECTSNTSCASSQCLPTGIFDMEKGGHQLCCIWDTFTILGANKTQAKALGVNAIYVGMVTIKIGNDLEMKLASQDAVSLSLRYRPTVDPSSFFLWLLAVCTVMLGSMMNVRKPSNGAPSGSNQDGFDPSTETIPELTASHALGFILSACTTLLILYFFQPHILLALIFAFLSTIATSSVLFTPLFERMSSFQVHVSFFGMSRGELCGTFCGGFIAVFWFIFRKEIQLTWLLQDGFGVCVCVFFLSTIRIPTLRIGAILLSLAFAYDVFFVFLTPLLFGSSVMEDVATGGKGPASKADFPGSDYCERYPQDSRCEWPEMVPMVMVMPILMDFVGGFTMLGYGM